MPFAISAATFDRINNPARGRKAGAAGAPGRFGLAHGKTFATKSVHKIPPGERLIVELPGGGGFGHPRRRDRTAILADVQAGYVSPDAAREVYGLDTGENDTP